MKPTAGTIARTIILALTIINSLLSIFGKSPLPISDATVEQLVSLIFTIAAALVSWWRNNSFTQAAIEADILKDRLKAEKDNTQGVEKREL